MSNIVGNFLTWTDGFFDNVAGGNGDDESPDVDNVDVDDDDEEEKGDE